MITDFDLVRDKVELTGLGVSNLNDVLGLANQSGADAVIDFGGGDVLTLEDIAVADLAANDFVFA